MCLKRFLGKGPHRTKSSMTGKRNKPPENGFKIRSCIARTDLKNKAFYYFGLILKIRSCSARSDPKNKRARFSGTKCPQNLYDKNDKDNSDSYKQGVECWIHGNHGNHGNDENHRNPGCKTRVPQTTGLEMPDHLRSFAAFCALAFSFLCGHLRSFALICVFLRPTARLERPHLGTAEECPKPVFCSGFRRPPPEIRFRLRCDGLTICLFVAGCLVATFLHGNPPLRRMKKGKPSQNPPKTPETILVAKKQNM